MIMGMIMGVMNHNGNDTGNGIVLFYNVYLNHFLHLPLAELFEKAKEMWILIFDHWLEQESANGFLVITNGYAIIYHLSWCNVSSLHQFEHEKSRIHGWRVIKIDATQKKKD